MNSFKIADCEFGIDLRESSAELREAEGGVFLLTIDAYGSKKEFKKLTSSDDSKWSWALSPPRLYAYDIPITKDFWARKEAVHIDDEAPLEMAIYMMEHNSVSSVALKGDAGRLVYISGSVSLLGEDLPFSISLVVPVAGA